MCPIEISGAIGRYRHCMSMYIYIYICICGRCPILPSEQNDLFAQIQSSFRAHHRELSRKLTILLSQNPKFLSRAP